MTREGPDLGGGGADITEASAPRHSKVPGAGTDTALFL